MARRYKLLKKPFPDSPTILRSVDYGFIIPAMTDKYIVFMDDARHFIENVVTPKGEYIFEFVEETKQESNVLQLSLGQPAEDNA